MIDMVTRLDVILKQIQLGIRQTNKPFSMFYKPGYSVIDIYEDTPIMRGNIQYI